MASGSGFPPAFLSILFVLPCRAVLLLQVEILHVVLARSSSWRGRSGSARRREGVHESEKEVRPSLRTRYMATHHVLLCFALPCPVFVFVAAAAGQKGASALAYKQRWCCQPLAYPIEGRAELIAGCLGLLAIVG